MFRNHASETAGRVGSYDTDNTKAEAIRSFARKNEWQSLFVIREAQALESKLNNAWAHAR